MSRPALQRLRQRISRVTSWDGFWWMAWIAVLAATVALPVVFWDWLSAGESGSTTIRNIGLVVGGAVAILLAIWRGLVAEQSLLDERYQKGAEMLGSDILSVRLGGIYALQRLAKEHSAAYHVQIMRLLCAFVRNPTPSGGGEDGQDAEGKPPRTVTSLREDVQAAMEAIGARREQHHDLEREAGFRLDLHGANLPNAQISDLNFSGADFTRADLSHADLKGANLSGAEFFFAKLSVASLDGADLSKAELVHARLSDAILCGANLCKADLAGANLPDALLFGATLSKAKLDGTNLTRADLAGTPTFSASPDPVIGLTQSQLDEARADESNAPELDGVEDAETGKPLVWRG